MANPILGIMTLYMDKKRVEELSYYRKLSLAAEPLGLDVMVFTPEDIESPGKEIKAWIYDGEAKRWVAKRSRFPDIIYDRCRYQRSYRFYLLRKFRAAYPNLLYMSRPLSHKWGNHQVMYKSRLIRPFLPETIHYKSGESILSMLNKHNLLYVKPIDGTGGRGILRVEALGTDECRVSGRDRDRRIIRPFRISRSKLPARLRSWNLTRRYLVQQGIPIKLPDGRVHDFRLLIQKNRQGEWEVTGSAGRIGPKRSITSNLHGGGRAVPTRHLLRMRFPAEAKINQIEGDMERLAHYVVQQVEKQFGSMCELALDIAVDHSGRVWLLEINPKPAREVFYRIGELDTYRKAINRPLEYALFLLSNKDR